MKEERYDLTVVGSGSAGMAAATACREAGWSVAVIDSNPIGGTCALRGCDPKKVLVGAADLIDRQRRMRDKGVEGPTRIDWSALMQFKRTFTDPVPSNRTKSLENAGIEVIHGRARFLDPQALQVDQRVLRSEHILLANGARPTPLRISGEEYLTTSDQFLELDWLPHRILFIGGGYVSFEFAHIAVRSGADVIIADRNERPLGGFDRDLVDLLVRRTRELDVTVSTDTEVKAVRAAGAELLASIEKDSQESEVEVDLVVHGAGRSPDLDDMELERGNVERNAGGVVVNEYLQSPSNPDVYAAGDAAASPGPPLTPIAGIEGRAAARNMIKGNHLTPDYTATPSVVFTIPPLAGVGLTEEQAKERRLDFGVKFQETSGWYSSRRIGEEISGFKTLVDDNDGRILGAHLLGERAEETINLFALAIRAGLTAGELQSLIPAYPSRASDVNYML